MTKFISTKGVLGTTQLCEKSEKIRKYVWIKINKSSKKRGL